MSAIHNIPIPAKDTTIEAKKPFPGGRGRTMTNASEKYRPYGVVDLPDGVLIPPVVANDTLYILTEDADLIAFR